MTRFRPALLLSLIAAIALSIAACGGDDSSGGEEASASTDVNELLTQTFTGSKDVKSGNVDLKLQIEAQGGESQLDGPISVTLKGPFQAQDGGKLPKFKLDAAVEGAGQSIKAGATSTGEKGFVSFQGTDYVLSDQVFKQFKAGFEEAQKQGSDDKQSFATLGMDPRKWLTDAKNAGEAKVGDDDTIKITGSVDVAKLLDDVNAALGKASSLGLQGAGQVPEKLTEEQRRQVLDAVKDPQRRDLHRQGRPDPSPHGRQPRRRGLRQRHQRHGRVRRLDHRPQRGPGHRRAGGCQAVRRAARAARRPGARRRGGLRIGLGLLRRRRRRSAAARPRTSRSSRSASRTRARTSTEARKCSELITG